MSTSDRTPTRFLSPFAPAITHDAFRREVFAAIGQVLIGKINMATARWMVPKKFRELRYDPACGFPPERRDLPIDLSLGNGIDLMLETEVSLTRAEGYWREGNGEFARYAWPVWEVVQSGQVDPHDEWKRRWRAAGESVRWKGARQPRMWAFKDSPIWAALGAGAGGFADALGYPYPPFALGSPKWWRQVPREEWFDLPAPTMRHTRAPTQAEENAVFDALTPEVRKKLIQSWSSAPDREPRNEVKEACDSLGPDFAGKLIEELEDIIESKIPTAPDPKEIDAAFDALTPERQRRLKERLSE